MEHIPPETGSVVTREQQLFQLTHRLRQVLKKSLEVHETSRTLYSQLQATFESSEAQSLVLKRFQYYITTLGEWGQKQPLNDAAVRHLSHQLIGAFTTTANELAGRALLKYDSTTWPAAAYPPGQIPPWLLETSNLPESFSYVDPTSLLSQDQQKRTEIVRMVGNLVARIILHNMAGRFAPGQLTSDEAQANRSRWEEFLMNTGAADQEGLPGLATAYAMFLNYTTASLQQPEFVCLDPSQLENLRDECPSAVIGFDPEGSLVVNPKATSDAFKQELLEASGPSSPAQLRQLDKNHPLRQTLASALELWNAAQPLRSESPHAAPEKLTGAS